MSARTIKGSTELGAKIRARRNELGMTIEEAAAKANVGTKTWSRYESGESIRSDKILSVCKTLNWNRPPEQGEEDILPEFKIEDYKRRDVWPKGLANAFGDAAALSFVIGSDILLDNIEQDLDALSHRPKGTHIGELDFSCLEDSLPPQFLPQYDYDFLYYFRYVVMLYRLQASNGNCFSAHTVMEELALYMIMEESRFLMEAILPKLKLKKKYSYIDWDEWPFEIFEDSDVEMCLYSEYEYLTEDHCYHFKHWRTKQFWCSPSTEEEERPESSEEYR